MASNQDQYNEKNAQLIAAFEDLLKKKFSALNLNGAGVGAAAGADSLNEIAVGDAAAVRNAIGFVTAALAEMQEFGLGCDSATVPRLYPLNSLEADPTSVKSGTYIVFSSVVGYPLSASSTAIFTRYNSSSASIILIENSGASPRLAYRSYYAGWGKWVEVRTTANTTVDGNGFLKSASPIFRVASTADDAAGGEFSYAGAGTANVEADGVTATHDDTGVYTISGSLGFATEGWTITLPQDPNTAQTMVMVETEQADDGTITVRVYSRKFDINTASIVAGDPMDIPDGRWIDLRLSMPAREPDVVDEPDAIDELPAEE